MGSSAERSPGRRGKVDVPALVEGVLGRQRPAVSRAITLVESTRPDHRQQAQELLDVRGQDALDDLPHRRAEAARCVHLDHDGGVALVLRPVDRAEEEVLRDRVDVVLELGHEYPLAGVGADGDRDATKRHDMGRTAVDVPVKNRASTAARMNDLRM